jgi:phosphoribosylformylglycinamidine synthase subunit PurL
MRIGIIQYPGSNCDMDTFNYFGNALFIWYKETILPEIDLLIIPGGFAFGDRYYEKATDTYTISPGTMAIEAPVSVLIREATDKKIPIFGICNGFQILIKLGLLPGTLELNKNGKFICKKVECLYNFYVGSEAEAVNQDYVKYSGNVNMWVAHSFGNYKRVRGQGQEQSSSWDDSQIFLKYKSFDNGSDDLIAGISNKDQTIFGMMPHPERNSNFKNALLNILFHRQAHLKHRIGNLMTNEHISYKSTRKYLRDLYTKNQHVIQGPGENAGIVEISPEYALALRIESHNHPTYIDPFEGAATGVGGILRDIFTMGARPIALLDFLRFGKDAYSAWLLEKAIDGIAYYTNCVGVANVGGDLYKAGCYNKNPLVNVACIGLLKKENIIYGNALNEGSLLIYVGSKTGREGVDGASMASREMQVGAENDVSLCENIQKSDPFLEKLLMEACCQIAEEKLAEGMQDMGAGGLLCASIEVIKRGREKSGKNLGCRINMDHIPIKYAMDDAYDILASESQERMLIISTPQNKDRIGEIFQKWDLEYSVIGEVSNDGYYSIYRNDLLIYDERMVDFKDVEETYENIEGNEKGGNEKGGDEEDDEYSREKIKDMSLWQVYDQSIGGRLIKGPDKEGSYAILNIPEANKRLIISWGEDFMEAYNIIVENGGRALALINCLNFGNPKNCIGIFAEKLRELNEKCKIYEVPIVGGNVSLYNATDGRDIRPTIILTMIGLL